VRKLLAGIVDARERHKQRHRPSGFEFALADSIHYLNGAHWDAVSVSPDFSLAELYLRFWKKAVANNSVCATH
jgi:hypothetical protein